MSSEKRKFEKPEVKKEDTYKTAGSEHCHQVKVNDCSYPAKA